MTEGHHHRYCKEGKGKTHADGHGRPVRDNTDAPRDLACEIDGCKFLAKTASGLNVHKARAHPAVRNEELRMPTGRSLPWQAEEIKILAQHELRENSARGWIGRFVSMGKLNRTTDAIRSFIRTNAYLEVRDHLRLEETQPQGPRTRAETRRDGTVPGVTPPEQLKADIPDDVRPRLVERLSNLLDEDQVSECVREYVRAAIKTKDPGSGYEDMLDSLIPKGSDVRTRKGKPPERASPPKNRRERRKAEYRCLQRFWKRDGTQLAQVVLDDVPTDVQEPPLSTVEDGVRHPVREGTSAGDDGAFRTERHVTTRMGLVDFISRAPKCESHQRRPEAPVSSGPGHVGNGGEAQSHQRVRSRRPLQHVAHPRTGA